MIGQIPTSGKDGKPVLGNGTKLSQSSFTEPKEAQDFRARFQKDFQVCWAMMHRGLDEFDGYSVLDRARLDQQTFGAFVGVEFVAPQKRWRFRGRKNTARNKIIGILAHLIVGMLFPHVSAKNEREEEDKMTAKVMGILVEDHLKRANYETKFMYMALSMLVNPAVFCGVEYIAALQTIKQKMADGTVKVEEVVDEMLSGLQLNVIPLDEMMFGDWYGGTGNVHGQPHIFRVRRISYDQARSIYAGKYKDENGKDLFDYVSAGSTRWMGGQDGKTLFDVPWDEADGNFVQEVTGYYRSEDIQMTYVGGIPMGNLTDIYNTNPFDHRRMVYQSGKWFSVPVYPFAMSGYEPIDPSGRFLYYKSAAFKEFWDDQKVNSIDRMLVDGVTLDVMKPIFLSGVAKFNSSVLAPGAVTTLPAGGKAEPYSLSPNLAAASKVILDGQQDMSESTVDKVMTGQTTPGITATQSVIAQNEARKNLGVAGVGVAKLVKEVGELAMDCEIQHGTIGELDASVPTSLRMKFKTVLAKGKDRGMNVTHKIIFTDKFMGKKLSKKEIRRREWELYKEAGGEGSDQRIYELDPYKFARTRYTMAIDADKIVQRSMGTDRQDKELAFAKLTDPRVMPFTDPEAVINDFVIDEYSNGDPERYKRKQGQEQMMQSLLGLAGQPGSGQPGTGLPPQMAGIK